MAGACTTRQCRGTADNPRILLLRSGCNSVAGRSLLRSASARVYGRGSALRPATNVASWPLVRIRSPLVHGGTDSQTALGSPSPIPVFQHVSGAHPSTTSSPRLPGKTTRKPTPTGRHQRPASPPPRMQPPIQHKPPLRPLPVLPLRHPRLHHHVPAAPRHHAREQHDAVQRRRLAAKRLLPRAGRAGRQPGGTSSGCTT